MVRCCWDLIYQAKLRLVGMVSLEPQDYQCFTRPEVAKPFCLLRRFVAARDPRHAVLGRNTYPRPSGEMRPRAVTAVPEKAVGKRTECDAEPGLVATRFLGSFPVSSANVNSPLHSASLSIWVEWLHPLEAWWYLSLSSGMDYRGLLCRHLTQLLVFGYGRVTVTNPAVCG